MTILRGVGWSSTSDAAVPTLIGLAPVAAGSADPFVLLREAVRPLARFFMVSIASVHALLYGEGDWGRKEPGSKEG